MRILLAAILTLFCAHARAAESAAFTDPHGTASLVSDVDSIAPGKPFHLGLRLKLAPGWHTYWSNPGDAGAPPELEITGAKTGPIAFPAPEKLRDGPFTSFVYTGEVLLPVTATAQGPASITAQASWLVCATVCVPENTTFHLDLPAGDAAPSPQAGLFAAAAARAPRQSPFPAHVTEHGVLWLAAPGLQLASVDFFPAEAGVIDQGAVQTRRVSPDRMELALKPLKPKLDALSGVLRLTDTGGQVANLWVSASPMPLPATPQAATKAAAPLLAGAADAPGLLRALALAFAGGLILNLMPCVLPVLAIKALSLAKLSGASRAKVRGDAAAYTLGVVVAFCFIGTATLALRAAGDATGWGTQFQSAIFTTATGWLLFAMGLNMSGVFMLGGQFAGAGQAFAARGSFATGLLAVVVATPCTAPFMGAALAAALSMNPAAGMLIFVFLGLGLATPYAALALSPGVARLLPRPGAWMELFKQILAFPMYASALWMVWVASQQTDQAGLAAVLASFLLIGFAAWAFGLAQTRERAGVLRGSALAGVAGGVALLVAVGTAAAPASPDARGAPGVSADGSEPYSAARLASLLAAHQPVLVDMSAAWCITCLVNERVALRPAEVRAAFAAHHVAYLKGDWTRRDEGITAFLHDHNRDGVPLYVYYPSDGEPVVLPQALSPDIVLGAIEQK